MKTQFFKNYLNLKENSRKTYESYLERIRRCFSEVRSNHNNNNCLKFQSQLNAFKDFKSMKPKDRQQIYKYFVERNVKSFNLMRNSQQVEMKILKLTKCPLDNYELDWKEVWEKLIRVEPEPSAFKLYGELIQFLKNIRHLYNPNNAVEVINYFMTKHSLYTDNLFVFISLFINLSDKTSREVLRGYLERLMELYEMNQLKASNLLVMFINTLKLKNSEISEKMYRQLNSIILYSLTTPNPDKKEAIEQKFNTQTSNIIIKILGKANPNSVSLLHQIFQIIKNFIRPFEDSKKPLKFLFQIISGISKRIQKQRLCEEKIAKLKEKEQKRLKTAKKEVPEEDSEESKLTQNEEPLSTITEPEGKEKKQEEEEEESSQEQSNENESEEDEQAVKIEKMVSMQLDIEQVSAPEKMSSSQSKIDKWETVLANRVTPQILECLREFISQQFESIFYVNSKKIVNKLLKELFKIFPEFVSKSFEALEKAGNIAQINEEGLISNIQHMAKYLFMEGVRSSPQFLDNILKILNRVNQNRRITDVWQIISTFTQRIPLLDEKDLQRVADKDKESFESQFGQNHDRFYESYSQAIFECLKRAFRQSEHYDQATNAVMDKQLLDLLSNAYPFYRKRVLREIEEEIIENNNKFLLTIFHSDHRPSPQFEQQLRDMIENRNIDNEQNLELDINVNLILSASMPIDTLKSLIRKYSKKNNYKFLKQCVINLSNYTLLYDPFKTDLSHFTAKPPINLRQEPTLSFLSDKLRHVYEYSLEVLDELCKEVSQFGENPLQDVAYEEIVSRLYGKEQTDYKNLKIQKRKLINELLEILKIISENLFHEMGEYNAEKNSIELTALPFKRESLIANPKFITVLQALAYNEIFLHDQNIMHNLSSLLENEVFFMYRHQIRLEKSVVKKYSKKEEKQQLPGESSIINVNNIYIARTRLMHLSILMNRYKDSVEVEQIGKELRVVLVAPGNDKSNTINKILVKKSKNVNEEANHLIRLLRNSSFNSRFYYEKVLTLLSDFNTAGCNYTSQQILQLIELHLPLTQSQNIKIREQSLKSFEKLLKTLNKQNLMGSVQNSLRKYINREKLEIVWILAVIIVLKEPIRETPLDFYLQNILEYMQLLEKLILSDTRIVRRISIFAYSYCFRKAKKAVKRYTLITAQSEKYERVRTIYEVFRDGYLRDAHKDLPNISSKTMVKKMQPYTQLYSKDKEAHPLFTLIQESSFAFVRDNPEVGLNILKQFHTDMAGSVEQVMSMMQNKKQDLSEITMKILEGCYMYSKLKKLNFDRLEYYFGERFFRYLFDKDAKTNDMKVFKHSRGYIEEQLSNLEPYDNQTLVFIYMMDIFIVYQKNYTALSSETCTQTQNFLLKVTNQIIYKGSGVLFKKLVLIFSKVSEVKSLEFLVQHLEDLMRRKEKLARVTQLLFAILEDSYEQFEKTTRYILEERLDINNNYINVLINTIISLPEKYIITRQANQRHAIIDPQRQIAEGRLQIYKNSFYLLSTDKFNRFLVGTLKGYLEEANKHVQSEEATSGGENSHTVKSRNELIKSIYSMATNSLSAFIQFYETEETIWAIKELIAILFRLFEFKLDHFVDFKQFEESLKNIFSNKYEQIGHFEEISAMIMDNMHKIPVKKQGELIKIIANRPGNFLWVGRALYKQTLVKMLRLEENSMLYRDLLLAIATLLAYAPLHQSEIEDLSANLPKSQCLLILKSYVLSTLQIGSKFMERILREGGKERRNMFCKQILLMRGKKEYLDGEREYLQWKQIKQYSNPYHYHA